MYFMGKSKIMDFECGPSKLRSRQKSILELVERALQLREVKVDI